MLTCGSVQLFFGYAESYTLVSLLSLLSLTAGLRSLRLGAGASGAAFLGGLAVCFHPLAFTLGPALLLLAWGSIRRLALAAVCYVLPMIGPESGSKTLFWRTCPEMSRSTLGSI